MFQNYDNEIMEHKTPERLLSVLEINVTDAVIKKNKKKNRKNRNKKHNATLIKSTTIIMNESSFDDLSNDNNIESDNVSSIDNDTIISSIDTINTMNESSFDDLSICEKESYDSFSNVDSDSIITSYDSINISFSKYIPTDDKPIITDLLNNLFETNDSFNHYHNIFVAKPIHYDSSVKTNSQHFTARFNNDIETTDNYHFYITNDTITSITKIVNLLDK